MSPSAAVPVRAGFHRGSVTLPSLAAEMFGADLASAVALALASLPNASASAPGSGRRSPLGWRGDGATTPPVGGRAGESLIWEVGWRDLGGGGLGLGLNW